MKRRMLYSVLIILVALASMGGATLAWFTATAELTNTFTAGTLEIDAEDNWQGLAQNVIWENANPGDCKPKEFKITNKGSKGMYLRFQFDGSWEDVGGFPNPHSIDFTGFVPDNTLVTISPSVLDEDDWIEIDGWWYYQGPVDGILAGGINKVVEFTFLVCLDGEGTDNKYQGADFTIDFTFQAIQTTHEAAFDVWGVAYIIDLTNGLSGGWYQVVGAGTTWETVLTIGSTPTNYEWIKATETWEQKVI